MISLGLRLSLRGGREAGLRLAYGIPMGNVSGNGKLSDGVGGQVPIIIDLGVAQSGARQFREAIATFTRGLEIEPNNALLLRWRGHRYLSVREFDRAFACLDRAMKDHSAGLIYLHLDPGYTPLRNEPRFQALVQRIGLK